MDKYNFTEEELIEQFEDSMKHFNVAAFVEANAPKKVTASGEYVSAMSDSDLEHVEAGIRNLIDIYRGVDCGGHFLTAVIRNDLMDATTRADGSNYRGLVIYSLFLYNHVPNELVRMFREKYKK